MEENIVSITPDVAGAVAAISGGVLIVSLILSILIIAGMWKVFVKAGKPGWASIIPIYNIVVMLQIAGMSPWLAILPVLMIIPIVNIVVGIAWFVISIILSVKISKVFGKPSVYALGLIFLPFIFYPVLGFGKAQYLGMASAPSEPMPAQVPPTV
ncbi:MAG: DUF5684 domain-containing protein [Candidatus Colwellbacteria bacterium]|nr:DUF5684 domain-containing protein [Candidatus Colwellbacteria bacterium]